MVGVEAFKRDFESAKDLLPDLSFSADENGVPFVHGRIWLRDAHGVCIDHYLVRIVPTASYPFQFPLVFETGGRIPINFDWHVFEQDGHLCIRVLPEEIIICKKGLEFLSFIKEQLIPYLFNQKYREMNGYFLKERSHGDAGGIEYFQELFATTDLKVIAQGMAIVRSKRFPKRVANCFCGRKLKYRKCHRNAIAVTSQYSLKDLAYFFSMVLKEIESS